MEFSIEKKKDAFCLIIENVGTVRVTRKDIDNLRLEIESFYINEDYDGFGNLIKKDENGGPRDNR